MDKDTLRSLTSERNAYAGIGSRETPPPVIRLMRLIGKTLGERGILLRSGAAEGADTAFETGCDLANGPKEIYLPWKGFNDSTSPLHPPSLPAMLMAEKIHPAWRACSQGAQKLHARNCHQVLGKNLDSPVGFILFYAKVKGTEVQGGTATAVKLGRNHGIPAFNLLDPEVFAEWQAFCESES